MMSLDDLDEEGLSPWPALADLLAATAMLFLVLFAVFAKPTLDEAACTNVEQSELDRISTMLRSMTGDFQAVSTVGQYVLVTAVGDATFPKYESELEKFPSHGKNLLLDLATAFRPKSLGSVIYEIQVVGHASPDEGSDRQLSAKRAGSIAQFLVDSASVASCKVSAISYGKYDPANSGAPESGRPAFSKALGESRDRRIDLVIRPRCAGEPGQEDRLSGCDQSER
jgi:outer membrane protein OmpA-like peptidoglycan-associated protein